MKKRLTGILSTVVLTIALVTFTGSALAGGNGNGNPNGGGNSANAPGNSASAPGSSASAPGNSANAPGQTKKSTPTPSTSSHGNSGHMQNSPAQPGVKPANNTQHNTVAPATSNKTKLYGNGKTAGQIAVSHGYTGNLYGPGNSQPHKVTDCRGHSVDVHALKSKSHAAANCTATTQTPTTHKVKTTTPVSVVTPSVGQVTPVVVGGVLGSAAAAKSSTGGVLGAVAGAKGRGVRGGVLGAVASAKRHGNLPFTGFPVWVALLIGFSLTATGLGLRRYARAEI